MINGPDPKPDDENGEEPANSYEAEQKYLEPLEEFGEKKEELTYDDEIETEPGED